jgi:hypothetical protein
MASRFRFPRVGNGREDVDRHAGAEKPLANSVTCHPWLPTVERPISGQLCLHRVCVSIQLSGGSADVLIRFQPNAVSKAGGGKRRINWCSALLLQTVSPRHLHYNPLRDDRKFVRSSQQVSSVPRSSPRGRSGARYPRHARAPRACAWLRSSHPLHVRSGAFLDEANMGRPSEVSRYIRDPEGNLIEPIAAAWGAPRA